jgi:hypothetical protein
MELIDFQESVVWSTKFVELNQRLEKIDSADSDVNVNKSTENEAWNFLPESFSGMKTLAKALLTTFGSSYACEQLFSTMNVIKSSSRKRLTNDMSAACVV